jgi:hypothetical protein
LLSLVQANPQILQVFHVTCSFPCNSLFLMACPLKQ